MVLSKVRVVIYAVFTFFGLLGMVAAHAASLNMTTAVKNALSAKYPGSKIELIGEIHWLSTPAAKRDSAGPIVLTGESTPGQALFQTQSGAIGWIAYAAWTSAKIAMRRIYPGARLTPDMFVTQKINIASGQAQAYRGLIISDDTNVSELQARQSILGGQPVLENEVERVPDIKQGEVVRVQVISGDLVVSTMGVAEEPGYVNTQVRIMANKTKRELVGELRPDGVVEVRL